MQSDANPRSSSTGLNGAPAVMGQPSGADQERGRGRERRQGRSVAGRDEENFMRNVGDGPTHALLAAKDHENHENDNDNDNDTHNTQPTTLTACWSYLTSSALMSSVPTGPHVAPETTFVVFVSAMWSSDRTGDGNPAMLLLEWGTTNTTNHGDGCSCLVRAGMNLAGRTGRA